MDDEKPNLRPNKRSTAHGKSVYLHYNPNQPNNKSYIQATYNETDKQQKENLTEKRNPFGNQQPNVLYSLDKHQRWDLLKDLREYIANQSSSSSDNELSSTQSNSERRRKKKKSIQKNDSNKNQPKYRLYEYHNVQRQLNCIGITTNSEEQRMQTPRKTYMQDKKSQSNKEDNKVDVNYVAVVPTPRDKCLTNVRKHNGSKNRKITSGAQCGKLNQTQGKSDVEEQSEKDEDEEFFTDEDELYSISPKHDKLQLTDFIQTRSTSNISKTTAKSKLDKSIDSKDNNSSQSTKKIFYRQRSKEDDFHRTKPTKSKETIKSKENPSYLLSLSFRTIHLHRSDLTIEHLSKTYGKNFIHAQCYPTKYVIDLTDRLRSLHWSNNFELFPASTALNCYLIIVFNDDIDSNENICQGEVALNMDLNINTIEIENLSSSIESIYQIEELITKTTEFIAKLSSKLFKSKELEINQRKVLKNEAESELSDSEFINKKIRQVQILDQKDSQMKILANDSNNDEILIDHNHSIRPEICTNCYSDMNQSIPMTALKSCGHWLCNECWKQYLENSVKQIKVILCPEWNCCSIVDIGTMLSLVNIRCSNIYERNIERCLVNLSRSYVKCPQTSCSNIVQIIDSRIDQVRCRCGHQFCIDCKQELHFPATCSSYRAYIDEANRNGDFIYKHETKTIVIGRNCVSCHNFIEKNGGCNHMTCRCGAQFCWLCTGYWNDHYKGGTFQCPRLQVNLQKKYIVRERNSARKLYEYAIFHRHERAYQNQAKLVEHCKRLVGTIPLDKLPNKFDSSLIKTQIDKREALLRHCYEMVKYITYLHRICEFVSVAADGYANNPIEFSNSLSPLETVVLNLSQILESGRGYAAIEQLSHHHQASERIIERLRQARRMNSNGYMTS